MTNDSKYRKYLTLSCLTVVVTLTPATVKATIPGLAPLNIQLTQNSSSNNAEEAQIKKALLADAQKENLRLKIGTISIADGYALATAYDENTGGESVLKKHLGVWQVIGGTGGAFSKPEELVEIAKVPLPIARRLLQIRASQKR